MTSGRRGHRGGSIRHAAGAVVLLAACALAPSAQALPLYFETPGGWGFDAADVPGPVQAAPAGAAWRPAGDPAFGVVLSVTTDLAGVVGTEPASPSFTDPLRARVTYTVTNTTGALLQDDFLVFTRAGVDAASPGDPDPFPTLEPAEFGLDSAGLLFLSASPYVFGSVALPTLGVGATWQLELVHVVADGLGGRVVPSPGLAFLDRALPPAVPEPGPTPLALLALMAWLARLRLRRA